MSVRLRRRFANLPQRRQLEPSRNQLLRGQSGLREIEAESREIQNGVFPRDVSELVFLGVCRLRSGALRFEIPYRRSDGRRRSERNEEAADFVFPDSGNFADDRQGDGYRKLSVYLVVFRIGRLTHRRRSAYERHWRPRGRRGRERFRTSRMFRFGADVQRAFVRRAFRIERSPDSRHVVLSGRNGRNDHVFPIVPVLQRHGIRIRFRNREFAELLGELRQRLGYVRSEFLQGHQGGVSGKRRRYVFH